MPFNCFSSSAHDSLPRHYTPHSAQRKLPLGTGTNSSSRTAPRHPPYSTAALPPLEASTRRRRSVHRLHSGGSGSSEGVDKARIGSPVGFKHLAHGGGAVEWAAGRSEASETHPHPAIDLLAPSPAPSTNRTPRAVRRKSLDASLALHLSSSSTSSSPLPDARHARQPSASAPSSPTRAHPSPPRAEPALAAQPRPRPRSTLPAATTRKPPPQITPSVIRAAGGVERVRETGGVPSRLVGVGLAPAPAPASAKTGTAGQGGAARALRGDLREREEVKVEEKEEEQERERALQALEGWFAPSEIRAVGAGLALASSAAGGGAGRAQDPEQDRDDDDERAPYDTDTARAFRGAMADVEAALRADEGTGVGAVQEEGEGEGGRRAVGRAR